MAKTTQSPHKAPTKKISKDPKKKSKTPVKTSSKKRKSIPNKTARKTATPRPVKKIAKFGSTKKKASTFVAPSKKLKKKKAVAPSVRVDNSDLKDQHIFVPHKIFPKEKKPALGGWSAICTSVNGQRAYVSFPGYGHQKYFFSPDLVRQWMNDVRSKHPKGVSLKKKHAIEQPEVDSDEEEDNGEDGEEGGDQSGSDDSDSAEDK